MVKRNVDDFKEREDDEIAKGVDKIMSIIENGDTKVSKPTGRPKKKPRLRIARVEGQVLSYGIDEDIVTLYSAEGEHLNVNKEAIDDVIEELKELKGIIE